MIKTALLGDIAFNGIISTQPENNFLRYAKIIPLLKSVDFLCANLEVPIYSNLEKNENKSYIFFSDYAVTRNLLQKLNIRCVSLANNHIFDCKMSGLKATINLLDELEILHTGAGWKHEHIAPVIYTKENFKIGFLAYVDKATNPKTDNFQDLFINYFEPETVKQELINLKQKVDAIICSIHWGSEYTYYPSEEQVRIAHELINAGADIIMGHHPHTMQPFEIYNKSYIFYSLGGLTYGDDYWEGKLRALKIKTKRSYIPIFSNIISAPELVSTRELKGNYIIIEDRNVQKWVNTKWKLTLLSHKYKTIRLIVKFKERILDRMYEVVFGYYRSLFTDVLTPGNLRKIKYLFR